MATRIDRYIDDLQQKADIWEANVVLPYIRAYDAAYTNYERTLERQRDRNRLVAEMMVLSVSLVSGSFLMAAFATTSLRTLAGRAGLNLICSLNLNRTFNAYAWAANNPAVSFAVGKILDEMRDRLTTEAEDRIAELSEVPQLIGQSPLNYATVLREYLLRNKVAIHEVAKIVRDDSSLGSSEQDRLVNGLEDLPFCQLPGRNAVDVNRLSKKMELSFYMSHVLDTDHLLTRSLRPSPGGPYYERGSRTPIRQLPSSRDYPRDITTSGSFTTRRTIDYDTIGSEIRGRINELHGEVVGGPFFGDNCFGHSFFGCEATPEDLRYAERTLNALGRTTRPQLGTAFHSV